MGNAGHQLSNNIRKARKLRNVEENLGRNIARCFKVSQIETHYRSPYDHLFERIIFEGQRFILMYAITWTTSGKWALLSVSSSVLEDQKQYVRPGISWKCFPSCQRVPRRYQISLNWGIDGHLSCINPLPATSLGPCKKWKWGYR